MSTVEMSDIPGQVAPPAPKKELEPALITVEQSAPKDVEPSGADNQAFQEETTPGPAEETRPMLTYMDFIPNFISSPVNPDDAPVYARFSFVVDQANEWLKMNPDFTVWKCETISFKLIEEDQYDTKGVLHAESSYGINRFVMGLRLWLVPRMSDSMPVAQIGYTTAIPGEPYTDEDQGTHIKWEKTQAISSGGGNLAHDMISSVVNSLIPAGTTSSKEKEKGTADQEKTPVTDLTKQEQTAEPTTQASPPEPERKDIAAHLSEPTHRVSASYHSTMTNTIKGLNKQLARKPLPGVILNVENLTLRASTEQSRPQIVMDPECTSWAEVGRRNTVFVFAIRIFYLKGREEFCTIGFHDELPDMRRAGASVKFGPFSNVVFKMGNWLKHQKNIRVVNMQSVDMQCNLDQSNVYQVKTDISGFLETAHLSTRYAKILRLFYVTTSAKTDLPPYNTIQLKTRLFVPVRRAEKSFESFPKTMERVIKWLDYLRMPPFFVETVAYQIFTQGIGQAVLPDRVDSSVNRNSGRHILNTVRLYMPSEFIEPPPEIAPDVATVDQGWGCVIS